MKLEISKMKITLQDNSLTFTNYLSHILPIFIDLVCLL